MSPVRVLTWLLLIVVCVTLGLAVLGSIPEHTHSHHSKLHSHTSTSTTTPTSTPTHEPQSQSQSQLQSQSRIPSESVHMNDAKVDDPSSDTLSKLDDDGDDVGDVKVIDKYTLPVAPRIVAIGDIHGDLVALALILFESSIVDTMGTWIGNNTIVVMTGDLTDRTRDKHTTIQDEASEYTIYYWLISLNEQAREVGGAVHILIGNHELMNIQGYTSYASPENVRDTGGSHAARKAQFTPGTGQFAKLLAQHVSISISIGSWLFVHAGFTPAVTSYLRRMSPTPNHPLSLTTINTALHNYLLDIHSDDISQQKSLSALLDNEHGPIWSRHYGYELDHEYKGCQLLSQALSMISTPYSPTQYPLHMVIGHTPQYTNNPPQGINRVTCTKKQDDEKYEHQPGDIMEIWRIDVGQSRAFERLPKPVKGPIRTQQQARQQAEYDAWPAYQIHRRPAALIIVNDADVDIITANHTAYQHTQYYPSTWSSQPVNLTHLRMKHSQISYESQMMRETKYQQQSIEISMGS